MFIHSACITVNDEAFQQKKKKMSYRLAVSNIFVDSKMLEFTLLRERIVRL